MPWVGPEFHRCLMYKGALLGRNITEAPSNGILPVGRTGWPYFAWHWCNPKRSSSILTEGTFLFHFQSILHPEHVASYRKSALQGSVLYVQSFPRLNTITVLGCEMIYRSVVGFHLCLHIQGFCATCGTITETPSIVVCSSPGRADHTYLDTVAQTACCQIVHFLFYSTDWSQVIVYVTTRLGAVALPCYGASGLPICLCVPHALSCKAGGAIPVR